MSTLEICANSFTSALSAQNGGAVRAELCENMAEGGTTPSYGQIKRCVQQLSIEIWPIIRPRGGDFLYTDEEFEVMKEDIKLCKQLGCSGIVTGILTKDGDIDELRCQEILELSTPMPVAFHRAFDMCRDRKVSLEKLIKLGFVRVLTSGTANDALSGATVIAELIQQADGRIEIMPGAGIKPENIAKIRDSTGAKTFHSSAKTKISSEMSYRNPIAKMGSVADEYLHEQTSIDLVRALVNNLK